MERSGLAFWESVSKRFRYSPPLTPVDSDTAWYQLHAERCLAASGASPCRALLLGGLNRKIGDALTLSATVDGLDVRGVFVTLGGLIVRAEATGHAAATVVPR